jgi:hypothetical protein
VELRIPGDAWGSTLHFEQPTDISNLTLQLVPESDEVDLVSLIDVPLQLFVWPEALGTTQEFLEIQSGLSWDTSSLYSTGVVSLLSVEPRFLGDFNLDGNLTATDIDRLSQVVRNNLFDAKFDLNLDAIVDQEDRQFWIESLARTQSGDVDLDGVVGFTDFLALSRRFGDSHLGWSDGDLDGDGTVEFPDFLILANNFGKTPNAAYAVPEPSPCPLWMLLTLLRIIKGVRYRFSIKKQ